MLQGRAPRVGQESFIIGITGAAFAAALCLGACASTPSAPVGSGAAGATSVAGTGGDPSVMGSSGGVVTGSSGSTSAGQSPAAGTSSGGAAGTAGAAGAGGTAVSEILLPDPLDPAAADPDFSIQGEYAGSVKDGATDLPLAAQVIALGNGEFRAVFEPGGLPGDGFEGIKIDVNGKRTGDTAMFAPGVTAREVTTGGIPGNYAATAAAGKMTGSDPQGRPFELARVLRKSPTLAMPPPAGAILVFDGSGTTELIHGEPNDYPNTYFPGEGGMTPDGLLKEGATTVRKFGDCLVHVEFRVPFAPELDPNYRGNSGVYLQGAYEVNILDSLGLPGVSKDNGVIWGVRDPDVNMSFPPLSWQTFDIDFRAARWGGDQKLENARMTVRFNGILVHENVELPGATTHNPLPESPEPGPLFLQANPFPVRFRYIWVLPR